MNYTVIWLHVLAAEITRLYIRVRDNQPLEAKAMAEQLQKPGQPRLLQRRVVIIVEIVDSDDLVAALEQRARGRCANEPCGTRDQNSHDRAIGGAVWSAKALERRRESFMDRRRRRRRHLHRRGRSRVRRAGPDREAAVGESWPI